MPKIVADRVCAFKTIKEITESIENSNRETAAWGLQLHKKETLVQVFSCEFCEISKNNFFTEYLRTTASTSNYENLILVVRAFWYIWSQKFCKRHNQFFTKTQEETQVALTSPQQIINLLLQIIKVLCSWDRFIGFP